jgi:putative membrane protein
MMHGFEGMGWGWITGLIVLAAIIWVVVRATGQSNNQNPPGNKSALDILKERYTRGEIDKEEFEEKKRNLS